MAAVRLSAPTRSDPGIDYVGNDARKALTARAYDEATDGACPFIGRSGGNGESI